MSVRWHELSPISLPGFIYLFLDPDVVDSVAAKRVYEGGDHDHRDIAWVSLIGQIKWPAQRMKEREKEGACARPVGESMLRKDNLRARLAKYNTLQEQSHFRR